jgi:hypothetical protein
MPVRPRYLGAAAAAALLLVAGVVVTASRRDGQPNPSGSGVIRTPDVNGQSGTTNLQESGPDALPQASEQASGFVTPSTAAAAGDPNLIVFGLFSKGRMVAVTMGSLLHTIAHPNPQGFPASAASAVTGSAIATARVGDAVVVAATDQAQLVRLTHDFRQRDVLTVSDAIGSGDATILYGSLVPLGGDDLAVTLAFGSKVAALRVNVKSWQIVASKVYDDRFAGAPQGCLGPSGLAMVTTGHVDFLDPTTLERRRTATLDGAPVGAACLGKYVVVTSFDNGDIWLLDGDARVVAGFGYKGKGTTNIIAAPKLGAVFLTEPDSGKVFRCSPRSGQCVSSGRIGQKPTDLALVGNYLVVAVENDHALAVVDARTLRLIGTASIPDTPRTILAYGT